jgi:aryl-alcohol dehydrogenase-like predicted oxidoreductase
VIERFELAPGYSISRLIHGGWQFSAGHRLDGSALDDAVEVLIESAEAGVTTFDCADIYTGVEELYGRFLRRWKTTSAAVPIQIHTKFVPDASALPDVDRAYVDRIIERSLRRLGVERLDLVQFYWWRDEVPGMEAAALRLGELRDAGKIRHVAVTNMDVAHLARLRDAGVKPISDQVQYSVLDRRPEHGLADVCAREGMSLIAFGALAGGFLTGRWLGAGDPSEVDNRSLTKYRLIIDEFGGWDAYQRLLRELSAIARGHGVDPAAVAIRFVLQQRCVGAVITGATRRGQMPRNVQAFAFELTPEEMGRIRSLTDRAPGPPGDVFELERDRDGPHGRIMRYDLNRV